MASTIIERFHERVRGHPERTALRYKAAGDWKDVTWREYGEQVERAGKALMALGFQHGDKLSLLSTNRPNWHFADIACMSIGGCTAPIYVTNSPDQVAYIVGHSESKLAIVENPEQLEKILKTRDEVPNLQKVVVIEGYEGDADNYFVMTYEDFLAGAEQIEDSRYEEATRAVKPDDAATFVYTSGTTGPPKAVMLSHGNIWWTAQSSEQHIPIGDAEGARCLSYLPLSHIAERMISHLLQIYYGSTTWFAESLDTVRLLEEGVLSSVADANIGSIFGIGFPAWTGGVLQYINGYPGGLPGFTARARELADRYGARFTPPELLVAKADKGETFTDAA
jgi:long-chain acyl-CoA synthetase